MHREARRLKSAGRRAARAGVPRTLRLAEWLAILVAAGGRCAHCRQQVADLTLDHVLPLSQDGPHAASNIVAACEGCNRRRNRAAHQWFWGGWPA